MQRDDGAFLLGRLNAAAEAYDDGNCEAATGIYGSFLNTLDALGSGNPPRIEPDAAAILAADAEFLMDSCPQVFGP